MVEKLISSLELFRNANLEMIRLAGALIWGAILGAGAVLLHSAFVPFGLILALIGSGVGIWLVGRMWGLRRYKALSALAWIAVVLRAGSSGAGGELLVQGNFVGNALVVGGLAALVFGVTSRL